MLQVHQICFAFFLGAGHASCSTTSPRIPSGATIAARVQPPPINTSISTPYDEDAIVDIVTELYDVLVQLCYISSYDIARSSSTGEHAINETLCKMLHLEPTVVSLMKWLSERHPNGIEYGPFPSPVPIATEIRDGRDHKNVDIIDGGNLHFLDYNRQSRYLAEQGFRFVGTAPLAARRMLNMDLLSCPAA